MNNRNWIAVFLGLACLVLFVSVMGASGNWLNNSTENNGTSPQQINKTLNNMGNNNPPQDGNLPTEINADELTNKINDTTNNQNGDNTQNMPKISMPQMDANQMNTPQMKP